MAKFNEKISNLINAQLPEFVVEQHPKFATFLKTYYQLLESAELTLTNIEDTDGILLETETNQVNLLILDAGRLGSTRTQLDAGDKVLTEDSSFGKFTNGETVTGSTSKATAVIVAEDVDNSRIFVTSQNKFIVGETITGSTSGARAEITNYKPNPVQNISDLVRYKDPDKVIGRFLAQFRNEFLTTLPEQLATGVDKRKLIKNIKSLYQLKGTAEGNRIFFNLLFGDNAETIYPRENILRISDGQWGTRKILRGIDVTGDTSKLIGRTITGETSEATAVVENVFRFNFGDNEVTEFVISEDTVVGTFQIGEVVQGTESDINDVFIKTTVTGIPGTKNILNDGALYDSNATISLTGGGTGASFQVGDLGGGALTEIVIDDGGFDFEIGDDLVFTNDNTDGSGSQAFVSVVNGGFSPETGVANGDTLFGANPTSTDDLQKFLAGPVISHDGVYKKLTSSTGPDFGYLPGRVSIGLTSTVDDTILVGTDTKFTQTFRAGDKIFFASDAPNDITRTIQSVDSDTQITLTTPVTNADDTTDALYYRIRDEFGDVGEIRGWQSVTNNLVTTPNTQTLTRVHVKGGSGTGAWGYFTYSGGTPGNRNFGLVDGGKGYLSTDTLSIDKDLIGGTQDISLGSPRVLDGQALKGTLNSNTGSYNGVTEVGTMVGDTSGATATLRFSVFDTLLDGIDFNKNILYITYTGSNLFQKGEFVTVTLTDSTVFKIRLSATFGREGIGINREGIDETNIADRDSVYQMLRNLGANTEEDDHVVLEDATTEGDQYAGDKLVQERNTGIGDITDIFLISGGQGYKSLPTIGFTRPDGTSTSSGKDFKLKCFGTEIGRILGIKTIEHGIQHELSPTPPSIEFINNSIVKSVTGTFTVGETVTGLTSGFTAEVNSYDAARGLLKLDDVTGSPQVGELVRGGTSSAQATLHVTDHASATVNVVSISDTDGAFLNEDGWISENTMRVQDSLYYQDFSYVIKVGDSINTWRNAFEKTMHTAGFYFSGEVAITNRINAQIKSPVVGAISGAEESPILGILTTIFAVNFRRKLGTESDGTTLRANANQAHAGLANRPSSNTRDVTLTLKHRVTSLVSRVRRTDINGIRQLKRGFAYAGPNYNSINKYHNTAFLGGDRTNPSGITFATLSDIRIIGTGTEFDGDPAIFRMISNADARKIKTNFTFPSEITSSGSGSAGSSYDNNVIRFSTTNNTFDEA